MVTDAGLIESGIAEMYQSGDFRLKIISDSTGQPNTFASTDTAQATLFQGFLRQVPPSKAKGVCHGGAGGQGVAILNPAGGVSTNTRNPQDAFTGSVSQFNDVVRQDNTFAATVSDGTGLFGVNLLPGGDPAGNNFAEAFADIACRATIGALRSSAGAASVRMQTRRVDSGGGSPSIKVQSSGQTLNGSLGGVIFDEELPVHGTLGARPYPSVRLAMDGGSNVTGQTAHVFATRLYTGASVGVEIAAAGVGGADTANWIDPADDGAAGSGGAGAYVTDAALQDILAVHQSNVFMIYLSANEAGQIGTANWRTRFEKVIERHAAAALANGIVAKFLLVTQHACPSFATNFHDAMWDELVDILENGTAGHGDLNGVDYAAVSGDRIGIINMRQAIKARGPVANEIDAEGVFLEGSNNQATGTATWLYDQIHLARIGVDYVVETILQILNSPSVASGGGSRDRSRSREAMIRIARAA